MALKITIGQASETGLRERNEDFFGVVTPTDAQLSTKGALLAVADGVGGNAGGREASEMTVRGVLSDYYATPETWGVSVALDKILTALNRWLIAQASSHHEMSGMATTLSLLVLRGRHYTSAHVGDSRIYLLRQGQAHRLTEDHTLISAQLKAGTITKAEAAKSPYRNVITRAVGIQESVQVDTLAMDMMPGDLFMLCSDGLHGYMTDEETPVILGGAPWDQLPKKLIDLANSRGGKDNITTIVVGAGGEPSQEATAEAAAKIDALKAIPLFHHLTYKELTAVLAISSTRTYPGGREIVIEGQPGDELFVVVRGRVAVEKSGVEIGELKSGGHFGEMGLIDNAPRSATVRATEPTRVMVITRGELMQLMRKEPVLAVKLLWSFVQVLSDRLRDANTHLSQAMQELAMAQAVQPFMEED